LRGDDDRKKLAASYATKSQAALLPDQVPRPDGTPAGGRRFSIPHGTRLDGGGVLSVPGGKDPRSRATGYSVRPSRMTTVKAPGRA